MRRKIVSLMLVATMLVGGTFTVNAQNIPVTGDSTTGSSPSSFDVTADMLGGDLIVTVPDTLTLDYDAQNRQFSKTSQVNAKGNINPAKNLEVSVPTDIVYIHSENNTADAQGTLSFGATYGNNQKEVWTASDLRAGGALGINRDLTSTVPLSEVEFVGTYEATVLFDINLVDAN